MEDIKKPDISSEIELVILFNKCVGLLPTYSNPNGKSIFASKLVYYAYLLTLAIVGGLSHFMKTNCHLPENHRGFVTMTNSIGLSWLVVFGAYGLRKRHENTLEKALSLVQKVDEFLKKCQLRVPPNNSYYEMCAKYLFFILHPIPIVWLIMSIFEYQPNCETVIVALFFVGNVTFVNMILDLEVRQFTSVITGICQRFRLLSTHVLSPLKPDSLDQQRLEATIDMADVLERAADVMNKGYSPILLAIAAVIFTGSITGITTISSRVYNFGIWPEGPDEIGRPLIYVAAWLWLLVDLIGVSQQCCTQAKVFKSSVYFKTLDHIEPNPFFSVYLARGCDLKFDACGMLSLDYTFFQTMISSVCAYCIVLLQTSDQFIPAYGVDVSPFEISLSEETMEFTDYNHTPKTINFSEIDFDRKSIFQ